MLESNLNVLSISLPKKTLDEDYDPNSFKSTYRILQFLSELELYILTSNDDLNDNLCFFSLINLLYSNIGFREQYEVAYTRRPINLILINGLFEEFKKIIKSNKNIDGYITNTVNGYQIWLKDIFICENFTHVQETMKIEEPRSAYTFEEDAIKLNKYNISSWIINYNNGGFE